MALPRVAVPVVLLLSLVPPAEAQRPTADDYLDHLPRAPRIVGQTTASARLGLYGDPTAPGYRDEAPRDGVDDARADRLMLIAERFSPILRRNTDHVPREVEALMGDRVLLHVDTWRDDRRIASAEIDLGPPVAGAAGAAEGMGEGAYAGALAWDDSGLEALLRSLVPDRPRTGVRSPEGEEETVLYTDLAGQDEVSWRREHRRDPRGSRVYVHPFLHRVERAEGEPPYELVLQYWFFYPYNHEANNHEGDWEHINVSGTTAARAREHGEPPHEHGLLASADLAGGRLATHPIGYIGGNNKGMDELLQVWPRFLLSFNRDSHGTYPFPGVWRKVGPLDATEKIFGDVLPEVHPDPALPWHEVIADERYLTYRREDLILLPDWERLLPLMLEEPALRRRWAWFVLPIHLGFPAVPSPGAGTLSRVDLGNVAPMGPAYNSAWNRPGTTAVFREYVPTVLRVALAPISPLASLQSGWGALNHPLLLWGLMPGGNVAVTQLLPWTTGAMHGLGAPPAASSRG